MRPLPPLRARPRAQVAVGVVLALVGFAAVVQARSSGTSSLSGLRQTELVRILDDSEARSEQLAEELRTLQQDYDSLSRGRAADAAAAADARRRADELGILAGTLRATGPGVEVRIPDPQGRVRAVALLDLVQELRDAGAEAIQIGSVRVVVSTALEESAQGVRVDGTVVPQPYVVLAVGPAADLASALGIPGGVVESLQAAGVSPQVSQRASVLVSALHPG
ncbi:uncharacterized protein YlxW (UPF0749 family) [Motilibacter peucedani]|uniref:Uncharacterized protein YlxW (UPF0749 family) n=1 Tax=Motilibacter peucedani TaxID=598650 RepID=A0A420XSL0_9ACTN|nr:DUF881 domain-containing protein [Motilibacter peucedani]RKS77885.1 uncharacterized protein YlxW (UPF0749 family) [Motilibacter peucedani]